MPPSLKQEQPPGLDVPTGKEYEAISSESSQLHETDTEGQPPEDKEPVYITGIQFYMVQVAVTLAVALLFIDTSIVATAIPHITDQFKSLADVGWYGGAYQLGSASLLPLTGRIYYHFSSKWSFLAFFTLFELGSVLCGAATSSAMLIVGRTVAGMGGAGILSGALTIIASSMPLNKRPMANGIMMGVSQVGIVLGPLIGGALTEKSTWRWCFYINLPLGALCALFLIWVRIPDQIQKASPLVVLGRLHHHLDLVGFAIFAGSVIELLLALEFGGNQFAWNSATVIGLFCGVPVTLLVWLVWNWRLGDAALIPISMASKRAVWTSSLVQGLSMSTLFITSYYLPTYFQAVQNRSPIMSGVQLLPIIFGQLIFAILAGLLVSRTGFAMPYSLVGAGLGAIGSGLLTTLAPHTSLGKWFGYQVLSGAGRGLVMQMPIISMQAALDPSELSMANSLMMFTNSLFSSILLVAGNAILDGSLRSEIPKLAPTANLTEIMAVGSTGYRSVVSADDLPSIVQAYSNSLDKVFYLGAACATLAFLIAPGTGWIDIRKKDPQGQDACSIGGVSVGAVSR